MSELKFVGPGGEPFQDPTSVALVNNTAKTIDVTVPAGKKWVLLAIKMMNPDDVARVLDINKWKEAAKTTEIARLENISLGAGGIIHWPNTDATSVIRTTASNPAEIMSAGNTLEFQWASGGASTGATDADGIVIEYLEFPASMKDKAVLTPEEVAELKNIDWAFNPLKYPSYAKPLIAKLKAGWKQVPGNKNAWEDFQEAEPI